MDAPVAEGRGQPQTGWMGASQRGRGHTLGFVRRGVWPIVCDVGNAGTNDEDMTHTHRQGNAR